MLQWWLRVDPTASLGKLFTAIESPVVSSDKSVDKGDYIVLYTIIAIATYACAVTVFIVYHVVFTDYTIIVTSSKLDPDKLTVTDEGTVYVYVHVFVDTACDS